MNAKELFDYYNASKAHVHLSCSERIAEFFLDHFPLVKDMSLEDADIHFYYFLYEIFFE